MVVLQQIETIEKAALWAWPPERTMSVNGWLLRSSSDASNRTNSASTAASNAGLDPVPAIGKVERWYSEQAKIAAFQLFDFGRSNDLDDLLAERRYEVVTPSFVLVKPVADVMADQAIELATRPTAAVMNALSDPLWSAQIRACRAALFNRIRRPHVFALSHAAGIPVSGGLCVVDQGLAGIFAMRTRSDYRGQGYARAVLDRLLGWAGSMGAHTIYLQVEQDNKAALALYRSVGFEGAYTYWYRKPF